MKLILFVFCMIFASCSTRHYFADDVVGKYIDKTGSYELYLSDNGLCSITFRTADKGQGFWYIDNDSVICMFEKAQLIDLLSFGRAVEGKINFAILGNKLKNTEFFFNRKKLHTDKNNETVKWNAFTYHPDGQPINCLGLHSYKVDDIDKMPICYSVYPIKKYTGRTFKLLYSEDQYLVVDAKEIKTMPSDKILFIKKGELAVHTMNFDGEKIHLHSKACNDSDIIYTTEKNHIAPIYDIENGWFYVKITEDGEDIYGWLEPEMQCPYPFNDNPLE